MEGRAVFLSGQRVRPRSVLRRRPWVVESKAGFKWRHLPSVTIMPLLIKLPQGAQVVGLDRLAGSDPAEFGAQNMALAQLHQSAARLGFPVSPGFAVPATAFRWYLETTGLAPLISTALGELRPNQPASVSLTEARLQSALMDTPFPEPLADAIVEAYRKLANPTGEPATVQIHTCLTGGDVADLERTTADHAFTNVLGETAVLEACQRCFLSPYSRRALANRPTFGAPHSYGISIGVVKREPASHRAFGVLWTEEPETGFESVLLINSIRGQSPSDPPDEYLVFKPTLSTAPNPILMRSLGQSGPPKDVPGSERAPEVEADSHRKHFILDDATILNLARWGCALEEDFSRGSHHPTPLKIHWFWPGPGHLPGFSMANPQPAYPQHQRLQPTHFILVESGTVLVQGQSIGTRIASGKVRILDDPSQLALFQRGEILVVPRTDPEWEPVLRKAAGVVCEEPGRGGHAATTCRALGIPAIIGASEVTRLLRTGQEVTLSCAHSELGVVLDGLLKFQEEPLPVPTSLALHTQIHLDLEDPAHAFRLRAMPCDGMGLAYTDFLLRQQVGVHPSALLDYGKLPQSLRSRIDSLTSGYADKPEFFVSTLAEGIGRVAAAMYPKPVLVHLNELQSDEYAQLIGGMAYEEREANPMLGLRGVSRYSHPRFSGGFALECAAIRRVRAEMGFTNVKVAVPFCRTPKDAQQLLQQMAQLGLLRHQEGLEVWLKCELPCNLLLAEEFLSLFDGFLIDIPRLTQLTFGADLGSDPSGYLGARLQEPHPAMARLMTDFIEQAHRARKPVAACGAATGADPGFVRFVVGLGVDSIFAPGNFLLNTRLTVAEAEGAVIGGIGAQIADGFPCGN